MKRKNRRRRRAAFGTFFLLIVSALMLIGDVSPGFGDWDGHPGERKRVAASSCESVESDS